MAFTARCAARHTVALIALAITASACASNSPVVPSDTDLVPKALEPFTPPTRDNSPVQTDSVVYTLKRFLARYDGFVNAMYVNQTGSPVYFARCTSGANTPIFNISRTGRDSTRKTFVGTAWACVGGVPTGVIAPGEQMTLRIWIGSLDSPDANPSVTIDDRTGLFRVRFSLCMRAEANSDSCLLLPLAARSSNAFAIRPPE